MLCLTYQFARLFLNQSPIQYNFLISVHLPNSQISFHVKSLEKQKFRNKFSNGYTTLPFLFPSNHHTLNALQFCLEKPHHQAWQRLSVSLQASQLRPPTKFMNVNWGQRQYLSLPRRNWTEPPASFPKGDSQGWVKTVKTVQELGEKT